MRLLVCLLAGVLITPSALAMPLEAAASAGEKAESIAEKAVKEAKKICPRPVQVCIGGIEYDLGPGRGATYCETQEGCNISIPFWVPRKGPHGLVLEEWHVAVCVSLAGC